MKSHQLVVRVEVYEPGSRASTLRLTVPRDALQLLAENGSGQLFVTDAEMGAVSGVQTLILDVDRHADARQEPARTGLFDRTSAHGEPMKDGKLIASADSVWWEAGEARRSMRRAEVVDRMADKVQEVLRFAHRMPSMVDEQVRAALGVAFDAGCGPSPREKVVVASPTKSYTIDVVALELGLRTLESVVGDNSEADTDSYSALLAMLEDLGEQVAKGNAEKTVDGLHDLLSLLQVLGRGIERQLPAGSRP